MPKPVSIPTARELLEEGLCQPTVSQLWTQCVAQRAP